MSRLPFNPGDLERFMALVDGKPVGEARPNHPRVEVVYVVLKQNGDLSRHDLDQIAEFAKAAAVGASKVL